MSIAKEHRWLLLAVCAAQFFMPFMVAGVNAVLPPLGESLGASARELSLLGAVYTLGLVVFQLAGGTLGDIYGRRRVFLFGLSLFSVLALVLGFIPHIDVFIGLRLFQGMGAAMLSSSSLALLASAAPKEMRASYLGLSNVAVYAGIACGPPVGGLVAGWLGWRWLFWGTGLAALAAMCIMIFRVPLEWRTADKEPFDVPGCLLYGGAMAASVLALVLGFIPHIDVFIGLRLFQGMGAAMLSSSSLALLASAAPKEMRASYLGLSNVAVYAGIACGPPVGGLVAGWLGWRWLFWGTGLAALAAMCIMIFRVPLEWRTADKEPFDVPGCLLYGGAMAALTFGASCIADDHLVGGGLFLLCLVLLACFVWRELRSPFPMVDVRLLRRNRVLSLSLVAAFVNYCSFFGMVFFFSLYLQVGRGFSVQEAGLMLALQAAVQSLSSPLAARLCDRYDQGLISTVGTVFCGLGLLSAAFLDMDSSLWVIVGAQCLIGAGVSLFALPNTTIILEAAGPQRVGQASGLVGTVRTAGMLGNLTIITLTLSLFLGHEPVGTDNIDAFLHCMRVDMVLFGILSLLAVGCTLARNSSGAKAA